MQPLTLAETGPKYLKKGMAVGSLPAVLLSSSPWEDLGAYVGTYLQEEIRAEGFVRSIELFSRFLETAALLNTQLMNFTSIGSDSGIPPRLELRAYLSYRRLPQPLTFWRSQSKMEVDFVIGDTMGVEVKASSRINDRDVTGMQALAEEAKLKHKLVICQESHPRTAKDGISILPVAHFLTALWDGHYALG